ncbi:hypothetical protein FHG87_014506 [Trinorchestia longiramus]|nr:hypothetical protein FHG87_014506 [Trinorchestia longiramus]
MKKHYEDISPFLSVLEIGAWKVKCRHPANQITSVGAIGPFGEDSSSEELTRALFDAGFGGVTVERIYKDLHDNDYVLPNYNRQFNLHLAFSCSH